MLAKRPKHGIETMPHEILLPAGGGQVAKPDSLSEYLDCLPEVIDYGSAYVGRRKMFSGPEKQALVAEACNKGYKSPTVSR